MCFAIRGSSQHKDRYVLIVYPNRCILHIRIGILGCSLELVQRFERNGIVVGLCIEIRYLRFVGRNGRQKRILRRVAMDDISCVERCTGTEDL